MVVFFLAFFHPILLLQYGISETHVFCETRDQIKADCAFIMLHLCDFIYSFKKP